MKRKFLIGLLELGWTVAKFFVVLKLKEFKTCTSCQLDQWYSAKIINDAREYFPRFVPNVCAFPRLKISRFRIGSYFEKNLLFSWQK